ncbi:MAG: transporter substrate-binding domain-containing protein [Anaerolineales bacterium]|nr:transporter substrate-binding domain-containing protein [Anaerolineales bacterium]
MNVWFIYDTIKGNKMKRKIILVCSVLIVFTQLGWRQQPQQTQTIRACVYENAPKIYTDENGNAAGFWAVLLNYIAAQEGWEIVWVHGVWEDCLKWLENNQIDILPDTGWTQERSQIYTFSEETVLISWTRLYVPNGSEITSILDLEGKTIAGLKGSFNLDGPEGIKELTSQFGVNSTFVELENYTQVFEALQNGEVDAGITNKDFGNLNETSTM